MPAVDENEAIFAHRLLHFLELGISEKEAEHLANEGVDWHEARYLVRRGCPPELAYRILHPLPYLATGGAP